MRLTIGVVIMAGNALILMAGPSQAFERSSTILHEAVTPIHIAQVEQEKEQTPSGEIQERGVPRTPGMTAPSGGVMTAPGVLPPSRPPGTGGGGNLGPSATQLTSTECRNLGCQVVTTFNCIATNKACQCVKAICIDKDE